MREGADGALSRRTAPRPLVERTTMAEQLYRLDMRISPQDKALLKRRCDEFGMMQTDYMRMLINLPLRMVDEGMEEQSDLFVIDRWGGGQDRGPDTETRIPVQPKHPRAQCHCVLPEARRGGQSGCSRRAREREREAGSG